MKLEPTMRLAAVVGVIGAMATWFGVRPLHLRAAMVESETERLHEMVAAETVPAAMLSSVAQEAERRARMMEREKVGSLPMGPPDLADVIRRLSLPIDGVRVVDQTFTARRSASAGIGAPEWWKSRPVHVELVADWASIRGFLMLVDDLPNPVRTTSFRLERIDSDRGMARLHLELDALHLAESPAGRSDGASQVAVIQEDGP